MDALSSFERATEALKKTSLGKEILKEMAKTPLERWVNDINLDGTIIGRLEIYSGRYEKFN